MTDVDTFDDALEVAELAPWTKFASTLSRFEPTRVTHEVVPA